MLRSIDQDVQSLLRSHPDEFTFSSMSEGIAPVVWKSRMLTPLDIDRCANRRVVELAGALSEPREQARWKRLVRRLAESPGRTPPERVNRQLPRRQGWVWPAIRRVLAAADAPMQPVAIYAAVVDDLDRAVSKSTIKNELRRRLTMAPLELGQDGASRYFLV